jgi:hypothetical protein
MVLGGKCFKGDDAQKALKAIREDNDLIDFDKAKKEGGAYICVVEREMVSTI